MKWTNFQESKTELPEVTVEKVIEGFSTATNELAYLAIQPKSDFERITKTKLSGKFQFKVVLLSNYLSDYSFTVFEFAYNVDLYPVSMIISPVILQEINNRGENLLSSINFNDSQTFQNIVELTFDNPKFVEIVSGLMKIAKKNINKW